MPRRPLALLLTSVALTSGLAACSTRVPVEPAPDAGDPACATLVLSLPDTLAGLPRLLTTSQASAAWGSADHAIVLRCGVTPPGPTTDQCVTADDGTYSVDWVAVPGATDVGGYADWTFTTYGRSPAVEVFVPAAVTDTHSTAFLMELGRAISTVPPTRHCV
ncbi:DUF3515 domain-containing protein [Isoptericola sp. b441]|uniref:DUF3515 domain-containing protein n=1 Tax=Actinotalea lenta TaxID=3064654 RepID=A0ABT9DB93_9CELL|nr:DUF3515 domain-containing protein [Isoptericola sp. b441]MDO8108172.1 DUF3515 domain-containing protein [Isoptericola sp. b441]